MGETRVKVTHAYERLTSDNVSSCDIRESFDHMHRDDD